MRVIVAGGEVQRINEARRILLSEGLVCEPDDVVGYDRLQDSLAATHPDVVLIYCDGGGDDGLAAIRAARRLVAGPVLAVGDPNVALMREAMRAGAREYLDAGNLRHDLAAALSSIPAIERADSKHGCVISVFSPVAGAGASTVALNLAVSLAKAHAEGAGEVALVDLTPPPSDLCLLLDMTARHTLADVLLHHDRIDLRLLTGAMTRHASGLDVLPQAGYAEDLVLPEFHLSAGIVRQMFMLLRTGYGQAVVDLGHLFSEAQVEAVRLSSVVLLPVVADVPSLRRVRWALDTAESLGIGRDRFQIVLNRCGGKGQVARSKVEDALHTSVSATIADHGPLLTEARNEGQPGVELSGGVAKAFQMLAKTLHGSLAGAQA